MDPGHHQHYSPLRQVTRSDIVAWFDGHEYQTQDNDPCPFTPDELPTVANAARTNPALRAVLALAGIHAVQPRRIRTLLLDRRPGRRIDPDGIDQPLDDFTADAITCYGRRTPASLARRYQPTC